MKRKRGIQGTSKILFGNVDAATVIMGAGISILVALSTMIFGLRLKRAQ